MMGTPNSTLRHFLYARASCEKKAPPRFAIPIATPIRIPYICDVNASQVNKRWVVLQADTASRFEMDTPDIKVMLFLIGVQELGKGPMKFSKRQKEELMHIATCRLFSAMGFYELEGVDQDGWPHWKRVKPIPNYTLMEQELILKSLIIDYFEDYS